MTQQPPPQRRKKPLLVSITIRLPMDWAEWIHEQRTPNSEFVIAALRTHERWLGGEFTPKDRRMFQGNVTELHTDDQGVKRWIGVPAAHQRKETA